MKKRLFLMILCKTSIWTSCNKQKTTGAGEKVELNGPQLFIKTVNAAGSDEKQMKKDSLTVVNAHYFEVGLYETEDEPGSFAAKNKGALFDVVREDGSDIRFKSSAEFLTFMSELGYELVDHLNFKYHTDYTFEKK